MTQMRVYNKLALRAQVGDEEAGARGHAFALLNAFVDVAEAVDDGDSDSLDLSELAPAGLPAALQLPARDAAYAIEAQVEAAKEWVIEAAMQVRQADFISALDRVARSI